ncbi:hypothetical protein [Rhodococcus opacus]|uniref:hypothetical protein n=1 Tax=Rhodococcus opacus TaxID=37919 RepID=UPI0024731751|nr:hypothetical protein [Rhodococcus opacus]MDH6291951.1 hypothetical protein [Rhodococcus opacus]
MAEMSLEDWRTFLEARIEQERGNDEQALAVFDQLSETYPNDSHLSASRAYALQRLGRTQEAASSRLAARYASLGQALVGPNDKPDLWISALQDVLNEVDQPVQAAGLPSSPAMVVW